MDLEQALQRILELEKTNQDLTNTNLTLTDKTIKNDEVIENSKKEITRLKERNMDYFDQLNQQIKTKETTIDGTTKSNKDSEKVEISIDDIINNI